MGLQQGQTARDASSQLSFLLLIWPCGPQLLTNVFIAYALEREFAIKQYREESAIFRTNWAQRAQLLLALNDWLAHLIEQFIGRGWFPDYCQRLQIALVSRTRQLHTSANIRNTFAQG